MRVQRTAIINCMVYREIGCPPAPGTMQVPTLSIMAPGVCLQGLIVKMTAKRANALVLFVWSYFYAFLYNLIYKIISKLTIVNVLSLSLSGNASSLGPHFVKTGSLATMC